MNDANEMNETFDLQIEDLSVESQKGCISSALTVGSSSSDI
ncbi:hypothetical protein ACWC9U_37025 [Streptomyces sp. 900116325]